MYIARVKGLLNYEYIYLIPMILSAILSVRSFTRKSQIQFKIFSGLLLLTIVIELFAISWEWVLHKTLWWDFEQSNLWIYNAFLILRYLFTLVFLFFVLKVSLWKKIAISTIIPFIILSVVNYILIQTPHNVNSYTIILSNVILIILSLVYFKQVLEERRVIKLSSKPEFWIVLGIFIYYTGTIPFFILFNKLIASGSSLLSSFLFINDTLNIVMYTLYLISFLCLTQTKK